MSQEKALRYNQGKPKWSLVDFKSLEPLVKVMEYGAHKYSTFSDGVKTYKGSEISEKDSVSLTLIDSGKENWKKGLDKKEVLESLTRHLFALMDGEEFDRESGCSHIGHIMANAMMYNYHNQIDQNIKDMFKNCKPL